MNSREALKELLDERAELYNNPGFITDDPISIPHRFSKLQDIEISGFWIAMLAWGQRKTIINKGTELMSLMDNAPHQFITQHHESDLKRFLDFKHRTFNATDTLYFIEFLKHYYRQHNSLEDAFIHPSGLMREALISFNNQFFALPDHPTRTYKHVATPARKSTCKRLNMFLRWMVRQDDKGVDFGIWKRISPAELYCPLDVHVERIARKLKLLKRKQTDWLAVEELTQALRSLDPTDPVKYDFALFGMGVLENY